MRKKVYVLGNSIVKKDSLPTKIFANLRRELPDIDFLHIDPTEEFPQNSGEDLVFIDTVLGIKKVTCFKDLDQWCRSPLVTVHDFDLPVSLGLLQKLGKIKSVTIIGVPEKGDRKKISREVVGILKAI